MTDAAVLVPGFLGFDKIGTFSYFADRVVATLSGALTALEAPMPIIPLSTLSIGSLAERQVFLLDALDKIEADHLHLIGHSTGGVDIELLTRAEPTTPTRMDLWNRVRPRIRTVITLAAPHLGTTLTLCPAATMVRTLTPTAQGLRDAAELLQVATTHDLAERVAVIQGAASTGGGGLFAVRFFTKNPLLAELTPEARWHSFQTNPRAPRGVLDIQVSYYATGTPWPTDGDDLFNLLSLFIQGATYDAGHDAPPELLEASRQRINSPAVELFTSGVINKLVATLGMNDGVVNTVRQVLPGGVLSGLVAGDHGDVLGHYERVDPVTGQLLNPGLLTCGTAFDDKTFFSLYTDIARTIQLRVLS